MANIYAYCLKFRKYFRYIVTFFFCENMVCYSGDAMPPSLRVPIDLHKEL